MNRTTWLGPQDPEVLRCVEPMDAQRAFGSGSERGGEKLHQDPAVLPGWRTGPSSTWW